MKKVVSVILAGALLIGAGASYNYKQATAKSEVKKVEEKVKSKIDVQIHFARVIKIEELHKPAKGDLVAKDGQVTTFDIDGDNCKVEHWEGKAHKVGEMVCVAEINTQNPEFGTIYECMDCYGDVLGETLRNTMTDEQFEELIGRFEK